MRPNMESLELTWGHAAHLLVWFALFTEYLTTKKKIGVSVFQNINALIRHFVTNLSINGYFNGRFRRLNLLSKNEKMKEENRGRS